MTRQNDIYIYVVDLPVDEIVAPCGAFSYTVYINARLSYSGRVRAYNHALRHIQRGDFERHDVQQIEKDVRGE